jgi:hypothetical protein
MTTQTGVQDHAGHGPARRTFEDVWTGVDEIPGWMTQAQGQALWDCAARVPVDGRVVEIGSFQGRSTCVLTAAAAPGGARTTSVDPFFHRGDVVPQAQFEANLERMGLGGSVDMIVARSVEARPDWKGPLDFLYIDGKHDTRTVLDDLRWCRDVRDGGDVAIHDSFSSIGVTLGLLIGVLPSRSLRYRGRVGSLALFSRTTPDLRSRLALLGQLGWFTRNVLIKIVFRLYRPIARVTGRPAPVDPF